MPKVSGKDLISEIDGEVPEQTIAVRLRGHLGQTLRHPIRKHEAPERRDTCCCFRRHLTRPYLVFFLHLYHSNGSAI